MNTKIVLWTFCNLFFLFSLSPVLAIEYGGIGGRPAFPKEDNPRSQSIFIHEILPSETINDGVKIINNTADSKTLLIYATDDTPSTDGGFACEQLSEPIDSVGSWITLDKDEVTLKPNSSEIVPFTITAPENVDVGEHNGCIMIQKKQEKSENSGLNLSFRTGIRVALTVPGKIIKILKIMGFNVVDKNADTFILTPTIKNSGNISVDANVKVSVINKLTKKSTDFGGKYAVLKNNPLVLNFDFKKPFWGGMYGAKTIVTYNDGSSEKILESSFVDFSSMPVKQAQIYIGLVMTALIVIISVPLALVIRRNLRIRKWQVYLVSKNDTLAKLIKTRKVTWKEVVSVNKLKPPYEITIGDKIKLPPLK
jgi:hypothetical protein